MMNVMYASSSSARVTRILVGEGACATAGPSENGAASGGRRVLPASALLRARCCCCGCCCCCCCWLAVASVWPSRAKPLARCEPNRRAANAFTGLSVNTQFIAEDAGVGRRKAGAEGSSVSCA